MISESLEFLVSEIDTFLRLKGNVQGTDDLILINRIVDDQGKLAIDGDTVCATIVNIEEERVNRQGMPKVTRHENQMTSYANPQIDLNLYVLFAANFSTYTQGLKAIANIIGFFQKNRVFTPDSFPELDENIDKLVCELQTLGFEQLSYLWGTLGFSYLPSALYKIRLVSIDENEALRRGSLVNTYNLQTGGVK